MDIGRRLPAPAVAGIPAGSECGGHGSTHRQDVCVTRNNFGVKEMSPQVFARAIMGSFAFGAQETHFLDGKVYFETDLIKASAASRTLLMIRGSPKVCALTIAPSNNKWI